MMSNCPEGGQLPSLALRNDTGLYCCEFNSSTYYHVASNGTWNFRIAKGALLYLAFDQVQGNETRFRVMCGNPATVFANIIEQIVSWPSVNALCITGSTVEVIETDNGTTRLHRIENDTGTHVQTLNGLFGFVMPKADSWARIGPLILTFNDTTIDLVRYGLTIGQEPESIIWYIESSGSGGTIQPEITVLAVSVGVVIVVLALYWYRKHKAQTAEQ
jgi:hypothetical protein